MGEAGQRLRLRAQRRRKARLKLRICALGDVSRGKSLWPDGRGSWLSVDL